MISIKPIAEFYTDDDKAVFKSKADLKALAVRHQAKLAELEVVIASNVDLIPNAETQVQNLIAGIDAELPKPLDVQRADIQIAIRDIEQSLDFLAGRERQVNHQASVRLAKDIKPQVDIAEKELASALVTAHEKHVAYFVAKRSLLNSGIALCGQFGSTVDDVLGVPVNHLTPLADLFRGAVKAGYLNAMPKELR
jgi:hypothetical protein